jgi:hypothetical protein
MQALFKSYQHLFEFLNGDHLPHLLESYDALFIDNEIRPVTEPFFFIKPAGVVSHDLRRSKGTQQGIIKFELLTKDFLGSAMVGTDP